MNGHEVASSERLVAACDAGTSALRCGVFDLGGRLVAQARRPWAYDRDPSAPGGLSFDPEAAWGLMATVIREACAATASVGGRICAVSVTSQRLSLVLADESGRGIRGIPNIDRRAAAEASALGGESGELMYASAGRWPGAGHPACKLMWLAKHEPETSARTAKALSLGDWFIYKLCGFFATEPTSACETCLYDIVSGRWSEGAAARARVDASVLPAVLPSGRAVGAVDERTAELTGLPVGAIVAMGGGDTECGVLGLGARKAGDAAVITGSSAPVECVVDMPVMDREFRTLTNPFLVPSRWVVESNAMLTGASYGWIVSTLCDSKTEADRMRDYEALDREISATEPGAEGALCYLGSSIMDSRRGSFSATAGILAPMRAVTGLALTRGHLARAAMEAEAYAIRANVEQLRAVAGAPIGAILAGGGSLRSAAFRSILPDVLGIPVLASDDEATMRGCAMCAAAGAGLYGDIESACAAMAQRTLELAPDAARRGMYESPYRRWIEGFERMRGLSLD